MNQPAGFNLAAAFGTIFLTVTASQVVGLSTFWAVALVVLDVGICSAGGTWPASVGVAVIGWLFVTGFVVNNLGELHVAGPQDAWRLLLLLGVAAVCTAMSRRRQRTVRALGVIGPARLTEATFPALPARLDLVGSGGSVPVRASGVHG